MPACQESQRLRTLSSILQSQRLGMLGNLTVRVFRLRTFNFDIFPRMCSDPLRLIEIHETNRAGSTITLQSYERILTLFPIVFPAVSRARIAVRLSLLLRARFSVLLLSQEEEPPFRLLRFRWCRRLCVSEGGFGDRGGFLILRCRDV